MTAAELRALLAQGEGPRLEFKEAAIKPADLAETFVALANAQGGMVLLGVSDRGQPVGVRSPQAAHDLVLTAASRELCDPPIPLAGLDLVALLDGTRVLAVTVPSARQFHATHGRFLVRRGARNVALSTAEVADRARHLDAGGLLPIQLGGGYQAVYEVLRYRLTLELRDPEGQVAVLHRDQTLRCLQNGVVGLYHLVWGEGELFADYTVSSGVVGDRFRLGARHITLISLRQIKNRGDVVRLHIRRQVLGGWTRDEEWLETQVNHRTRALQVTVRFPAARPPQQASLLAEAAGTSRALDRRHWHRDPQGGVVLTWRTRQPSLGETYLLRWWW
ncbi:MAG TPA: ATP-binding protein [Chloroflexota bacterium]|jgi:hypothetical protein